MRLSSFFIVLFLLLTVVCLTVVCPVSAQLVNFHKINGEPLRETKYDRVDGVPYLGDGNWSEGNFVDNDGNKYPAMIMRYNAYEDELEVKQGSNVIVVDRSTIGSFTFTAVDAFGNKETFTFKNGITGDSEGGKYTNFRVLYENDRLKVLERVKKIQIRVTPAAYGESDYQKFVADSETFLWVDNDIKSIKLSPKSLSNAFPAHKNAIRDFIKSEGLDLDKPWALKTACDYIVSLLR